MVINFVKIIKINLALKTFVEKFNQQYGDKLNEQQKKLLSHYISSTDDDTEFKLYFYEEISRLKQTIQEKINNDNGNLLRVLVIKDPGRGS